jgi:hypothetical protein
MRRQLYLQLGFGSLFDFVTKDLGYEPASAMRRISAARLIQQIPEVKTKIQNGSLKLTVVAQAQSFFKKEEAVTGNRLKPEQKKQILRNLENKSSREAELELVKLRPESVKHSESLRPLTEEFTEIKFVITSDLKTKITELQNLLSHQLPNKNISSLMQLLVEKLYNDFKMKGKIAEITSEIKNNPTYTCAGVKNSSRIEQATVNKKSDSKVNQIAFFDLVPQIKCKPTHSGAGVNKSAQNKELNRSPSRYITTKVRKFIWSRDQGRCQYQSTVSGKKCESKHQLQIDHIHRFADGGGHKPENLRLLCRAHNNWRG